MEEYVRTSGSQAMITLAGTDGFQYRAYHFDTLAEIAATGIAKTMLPRFVADADTRLKCISNTVLEQPLWMLSHRQDRDTHHLKAARSWIRKLTQEKLTNDARN